MAARIAALGERTPGSAGELRAAHLVVERWRAAGAVAEGASAEIVGERVTAVLRSDDGWLEGPGGLVDPGRYAPLARSAEGRFEGAVARFEPGGPPPAAGTVWWWVSTEGAALEPIVDAAAAGGALALLVVVPRGVPIHDPLPADARAAQLPLLTLDADLAETWAPDGQVASVRLRGVVDLDVQTVAQGHVVGALEGRGSLSTESVAMVASLDGDASGLAAMVCAVEAASRRRLSLDHRRLVAVAVAGTPDDDGPMRAVLPALGDVAALVDVDALPSSALAAVGAENSRVVADAVRRAGPVRHLPDAAHLWTHRRVVEAKGIPALQVVADLEGAPGGAARWLTALVSELRSGPRPTWDGPPPPRRARPGLLPRPLWFGFQPDPRLSAWLRPGTALRTVDRDGPAWAAGLRPGDRVVAVDDLPLEVLWTDDPAGRSVEVRYVRADRLSASRLVPATRPGFEATGALAGERVPHLREPRESMLPDLRRLTFRGDVSEPIWAGPEALWLVRRPAAEGCPSVWRLSLVSGALTRVSPMGVWSPAPEGEDGFLGTSAPCPAEGRPEGADLWRYRDGVAGPALVAEGYQGEADACAGTLLYSGVVEGDVELFVQSADGVSRRLTSAIGWDGGARMLPSCRGWVHRRATQLGSEVWAGTLVDGALRPVTSWGVTTWAPQPLEDGRVLVSSDLGGSGSFDLWIAQDADPERITWHAGYDAEGVVSPDGRWLAFVSDRGGSGTDLYVARWVP